MRSTGASIVVALALVLAACASSDEREWMKVNQKYTTEEFRRDYAECSRGGRLDTACMRGRGWVDVSATPAREKPTYGPAAPDTPLLAPMPGTGY